MPFDRLRSSAVMQGAALRAWLRRLVTGKPVEAARMLPQDSVCDSRGEGLAVVAIVKDEASYIREWIEFHLMLGCARIIVYDNGSADGTPDVLAPYVRAGKAAVIPWRSFLSRTATGISAQKLANAHALANFGHQFRWMAFLDVDEFLFPREGDSLPAALEPHAHLPSLSLPWRNFGPNGHEERPPGLVIENYTECARFPPAPEQRALLRYKSVVDPSAIVGTANHVFPVRGHGHVMFNEDGRTIPKGRARDPSFAVCRNLQLNHYFTRSRAELAEREAKGRVSRNGRLVKNYTRRRLAQYDLATEQDTAILRFVEPLKERLAAEEEKDQSGSEPVLARKAGT